MRHEWLRADSLVIHLTNKLRTGVVIELCKGLEHIAALDGLHIDH